MPLIVGLDHLTLNVTNLETSVRDSSQLFGRAADWQGQVMNTPAAVFRLGNVYLFLRESVEAQGLAGVCFRVDNAARMERRLQRLAMGLEAEASDPLAEVPDINPAAAPIGVQTEATRGLPFSFVARESDAGVLAPQGGIYALDHLVIESSDANSTAFLLAAQLGLDMRADINRPQWGARLLFFRCGDLIVEVMQKLEEKREAESHDSFYGLSWRTENAAATQARLAAHHFDVSALRDGRKPGTQVFTVRDRTSSVPTLVLEPKA